MGCGCGTVDIAIGSDTRGPWFESSHWQLLINKFTVNCFQKDENKEKEARTGQFKKEGD